MRLQLLGDLRPRGDPGREIAAIGHIAAHRHGDALHGLVGARRRLGEQTFRITSYNVCYTKLLRGGGKYYELERVDLNNGVDLLIEQVGVAPDILVDNLPHATFEGEDAQLDTVV